MEFITAHWLDIVTTILGLAYILLEFKASLWMWVVGFAMQSLGIVLYYQKGLYADCGMEFYYLTMTVYGYWRWVRGKRSEERGARKVERGASYLSAISPSGWSCPGSWSLLLCGL